MVKFRLKRSLAFRWRPSLRTDRSRVNQSTRLLLELERQLLEAARRGAQEAPPDLVARIDTLLDDLRRIRTSREVDQVLQLCMIHIATRLHFHLRARPETRYQVSTSLYSPKHNLFVVKPCYLFPGRCSIQHPTILLARGQAPGRPRGDWPGSEVGLSGLALASGEILHCSRLQCDPRCPYYIPLESQSAAALAVPLGPDLGGILERFRGSPDPGASPGPHCCAGEGTVLAPSPRRQTGAPIFGVLNIDCTTDELGVREAQRILDDGDVRRVLDLMVDRLAGYQADRAAYRVLRNCTALLQLSQHTLEARHAYVAFLREISEVCDGADVTLHLRDMFDAGDRDRSVKLVIGFGPRFRGFLVGERYGDGLVGEAIETGEFRWLDRGQIAAASGAQAAGNPVRYRRLMPGTALNAVLPIRFHTRVIGAVNVEWDGGRVARMDTGEAKLYIQSKRPALERLSQYLALVVDHFDDQENERLLPPDDPPSQWEFKRKATSRRRVLAYYVNGALQRIDAGAQDKEVRDDATKLRYILRDIIDAVGYFLIFENKHRILASVRYRVSGGDGERLHLVYAHGIDQAVDPTKEGNGLGPSGPIPLRAGESVLATSAALGVALFGRVEDGKSFQADALCESLAPADDREMLRQPIHYIPAGRRPAYEVGVPLVFGGSVLGTFDFELFTVEATSPERPARDHDERPRPELTGYELAPFLEWARAITFSIAYAEDALAPETALGSLNERHRAAFRRFQRLCAQVVANVAIPLDLMTPIAAEYLRGLIPLGTLDIEPAAGDGGGAGMPDGAPAAAGEADAPRGLWLRGEKLGSLGMTLAAETEPPRSVFPERSMATGTSKLAHRFVAAFATAALASERRDLGDEFDSRDFKRMVSSVQEAFEERVEALKSDEAAHANLSPYALIECYFNLFHQALQRLLPERASGSIARQPCLHGWFLYMAQCTRKEDHEDVNLRCGSAFSRWVAMGTAEMIALVTRVLESPEPEKALADILGQKVAGELLASLPARLRDATSSFEGLEEVFLEALARRDRLYSDPRSSLTAATVAQKRPTSTLDLNRNPVRSERRSEWFFGDQTYCIVGVPIVLNGTSIGAVQIFRRREAVDDLRFFKNDEIEAVARLSKAVSDAIAAEVKVLEIPVLRDTAAAGTFTAKTRALGERVARRVRQRQMPLLVVCDFLEEDTLCRHFIEHYVSRAGGEGDGDGGGGDRCEVLTSHQLLNSFNDHDLETMTVPLVCVLHRDDPPGPRLHERLTALAGPGGDRALILFVAHENALAMAGMLRSDLVERQERGDEEEVLRVAFGLAEGNQDGRRDEIAILLRRSGPWTIDRVLAECGNSTGMIHNRAKIVLGNWKERANVPRRLFPEWYQPDEPGAPPSPARRAAKRRKR